MPSTRISRVRSVAKAQARRRTLARRGAPRDERHAPAVRDDGRVGDPQDRAGVVDHVQLAGLVLAERRDRPRCIQQLLARPDAAVPSQAPEATRAEVGVEVDAAHARMGAAPVDEATGDRRAERAAVVDDRQRQTARVAAGARWVALRALHPVPAVVLAARARGRLKVDLLARTLPDVADVQVAGLAVEAEPPGIAQPVGPDLGAAAGHADEGVGRRHGVGAGWSDRLDVEPQDLTEQAVRVLAVVVRIAATAAVAGADVQVAVLGTELH